MVKSPTSSDLLEPADTLPPIVTMASSMGTVTNQEIVIQLEFSENIIGLSADDFVVSSGKVTSISGTGKYYTATIVAADRGPITIDYVAGAVQDLSGNSNQDQHQATATFQPSTGAIDLSFGTNGYIDFSGPVSDLAVLADRSMIVIWIDTNTNEFVISKLLANGAMDNSFGTNGHARFSMASLNINTINSVKVDSLGRIVVSGIMEVSFEYDAFIMRFTPNGNLDTSFNGTGQRRIVGTSASQIEWIYDFIFLQDGSILTLGDTQDSDRGMAVKILNNGIQDTNWGSYGVQNGIYRNVGTVGDEVRFSAAAEDLLTGKIYLAGAGKSLSGDDAFRSLVVTRLNTNGTTDATFDGDGTWVSSGAFIETPSNGSLAAITFLKNGSGAVTKMLGGFHEYTGFMSPMNNFYFQYNVNPSNLTYDTLNFAAPTGYTSSPASTYMTRFAQLWDFPLPYPTVRPTLRNSKIYYSTNTGWVQFAENGTNFSHHVLNVADPISKLFDFDPNRVLGMTNANSTRLYRFFD